MPLLIPVLETQFAVPYKKDKAKSTAFLVAQIFLLPCQKYRLGASAEIQIAENEALARLALFCAGPATKSWFSGGRNQMKDRERWMELCRQASVEQDPRRLLELTAEIIPSWTKKKIGSFIAPPNQQATPTASVELALPDPSGLTLLITMDHQPH